MNGMLKEEEEELTREILRNPILSDLNFDSFKMGNPTDTRYMMEELQDLIDLEKGKSVNVCFDRAPLPAITLSVSPQSTISHLKRKFQAKYSSTMQGCEHGINWKYFWKTRELSLKDNMKSVRILDDSKTVADYGFQVSITGEEGKVNFVGFKAVLASRRK